MDLVAICNRLPSTSTEEFISTLRNYGECIDYSSDYERSKATKGIFVGIVNKVYDVVPKGKGGHPEHEALFISAKSLINNKRESEPFRIGFVGRIVQQLIDYNIKEGDAIGILKPTFFYSLDIPSLFAGSNDANIVWIGKNLQNSQVSDDVAKTSSESQNYTSLNMQRRGIENIRKTRIIAHDSESSSLPESSAVSSISLQRNVQIYRSAPVTLQKTSSQASVNNKRIPDSTTKSVSQKVQEKHLLANEDEHDKEIIDNIVSQNTAHDGSADISINNQNNTCCNSLSKLNARSACCNINHGNNSSCCPRSKVLSCQHNCHVSDCCRQSVCENRSFHSGTCTSRPFCDGFHRCCFFYRSSCCGHAVLPQCSYWNSACHCHNGGCSSSRCTDHSVRSTVLCPPAPRGQGYCACYQHSCSNFRVCGKSWNSCSKLFSCDRKCHNLGPSHHPKQVADNHCRNLCCNNCKESQGNKAAQSGNNLPQHENNLKNNSDALSDDSRTKDWLRHWSQAPPCLQTLPEALESNCSELSFRNPSSCNDCAHENIVLEKSEKNMVNATSNAPVISKEPNGSAEKMLEENKVSRRKKLFSPLDNSSILLDKSIYHSATIIEESTPFNSEDQTDDRPIYSFPSENNLGSSNNNNFSKPHDELPLSNPAKENIVNNNNAALHRSTNNKTEGTEGASIVLVKKKIVSNFSNEPFIEESVSCVKQNNQIQQPGSNPESVLISSEEQFPELRIDTPLSACINSQNTNSSEITKNQNSSDFTNNGKCENSVSGDVINVKAVNSSPNDGIVSNEKHDGASLNENLLSENNRNHDNPNGGTFKQPQSVERGENYINKGSKTVEENIGNEEMTHVQLEIETNKSSEKVLINDGINDADKLMVANEVCIEEVSQNNEPKGWSEKSVNKQTGLNINTDDGKEAEVIANETTPLQDTFHKKPERANSNISLSLSCHSRSKICDHQTEDMDIDYSCKDKGQKRNSNDNSDENVDAMEFTFEPKLMKKRKKCGSNHSSKCSRESKTSESGKSKENIGNNSVSSSGTFFDVNSDGLSPQKSSKWCMKSAEEVYGSENTTIETKVLMASGIKSESYNLRLFSSFEVVGAIVDVVPSLSSEKYGVIIKGFCNEGCRKEYSYEEYNEMVSLEENCSFCRLRYHLTCPGCSKNGKTHPLCLHYSFDIHLLDGKNVFRIVVDHQSGITLTGCKPQDYLSSKKCFTKINKIIAKLPINWAETVLLKAKIKVLSKGGIQMLTLQDTSFKKDLTLKKKHFKF